MTGAMTLWSFLHLFLSNGHPPLASPEQRECRETPPARMLSPDTEGPQGSQLQVSDGLCCHWSRNVLMRGGAEHLAFWGPEEEPENEINTGSVNKQFQNTSKITTCGIKKQRLLDLRFLFVCHFCQTGDCHSRGECLALVLELMSLLVTAR